MKLTSLILAAITVSLVGCASTSSNSAGWALITSATDPMTATAASGTSKAGEACVHNVLGIVAFGDASIETAKKSSGIKVVSSVDRDVFRILGFYGKSCTLVKGE